MLQKKIDVFVNEAEDTEEKQSVHTIEASKFIELHLKTTLVGLTHHLFDESKDILFQTFK